MAPDRNALAIGKEVKKLKDMHSKALRRREQEAADTLAQHRKDETAKLEHELPELAADSRTLASLTADPSNLGIRIIELSNNSVADDVVSLMNGESQLGPRPDLS